jgi:hypothetical protein
MNGILSAGYHDINLASECGNLLADWQGRLICYYHIITKHLSQTEHLILISDADIAHFSS